MTRDEMRLAMSQLRNSSEAAARTFKDSYLVLEELAAFYESLEPHDRNIADQVICEWIESDGEGLRFDAMSLVRKFRIRSAVMSLLQLEARLSTSMAPGAPFEREKAAKIRALLAETGD